MNGKLELRLKDWGDGTAELSAELRTTHFAGIGAASFNRRDLREKARAFSAFPLPVGQSIELVGGYWSKTHPATLEEEHLHISVSALGERGSLVLTVRLAVPALENETSLRSSVSVQAILEYSQLAKFSEEMLALVGGNIEAVTLDLRGENL